MYKLTFSSKAIEDLKSLLKSEPQVYKKAISLIKELELHPRTGAGKPILKRHNLAGFYARKISEKHRLVYAIKNEFITVNVVSAKGHYDDK